MANANQSDAAEDQTSAPFSGIRARAAGTPAPAPAIDLGGGTFLDLHAMEAGRAMKRKPPSKGVRGRNKAGTKTPESKKEPNLLVKEACMHKGVQCTVVASKLIVRSKRIFCVACTEEITHIPKTIRTHLVSNKHMTRVMRLERAEARSDLRQAFIHDFVETNPELKGASIAPEVHVARLGVVETWMKAGLPLSSLDDVRGILEKGSQLSLTDSSHLRQYVPLIEKFEKDRINDDISGQQLAIQFDGTSRLGEAINVVGRFVTEDFQINMRLLRFLTLAKHVDGDKLASLLNTILSELKHAGIGTESWPSPETVSQPTGPPWITSGLSSRWRWTRCACRTRSTTPASV